MSGPLSPELGTTPGAAESEDTGRSWVHPLAAFPSQTHPREYPSARPPWLTSTATNTETPTQTAYTFAPTLSTTNTLPHAHTHTNTYTCLTDMCVHGHSRHTQRGMQLHTHTHIVVQPHIHSKTKHETLPCALNSHVHVHIQTHVLFPSFSTPLPQAHHYDVQHPQSQIIISAPAAQTRARARACAPARAPLPTRARGGFSPAPAADPRCGGGSELRILQSAAVSEARRGRELE